MATYYAYCEKHGIIGSTYDNPDEPAALLVHHLDNVPDPHGKVDVIEQYSTNKYGQELIHLRKYRKQNTS